MPHGCGPRGLSCVAHRGGVGGVGWPRRARSPTALLQVPGRPPSQSCLQAGTLHPHPHFRKIVTQLGRVTWTDVTPMSPPGQRPLWGPNPLGGHLPCGWRALEGRAQPRLSWGSLPLETCRAPPGPTMCPPRGRGPADGPGKGWCPRRSHGAESGQPTQPPPLLAVTAGMGQAWGPLCQG